MRPAPPTVLTLDAGGTTFAFHAIRDDTDIVPPLVLPARGDDLTACLDTLRTGFARLKTAAGGAQAISFAFPGPADYPNGVIGDLGNLPAFRGGVPLGPILSRHFGIPVFINNDGNLFALGEAVAGCLPRVNRNLAERGQDRRYRNLLGVTLGTGFGGGIVTDGALLVGDTSAAGEIWLLRHKTRRDLNAEEGVSIRAVRTAYAERAGLPPDQAPEPRQLAAIADGQAAGDADAARESFRLLGETLGDALANALTLIDGAVVIGGGLAGAAHHFLPAVMAELNGAIHGHPRLESRVFNLEDPAEAERFYEGGEERVRHPDLPDSVPYQAAKRIPLCLSSLGTSRAVAIGAYRFALARIGT